MARSQKQAAASGSASGAVDAPSSTTAAEAAAAAAGVGFDLAGLNPEQLASIVYAASRSNQDGTNDAEGEEYPAAYEQGSSSGTTNNNGNGELAHLPPGLGQAASALTSFAAGVKRTTPAAARDDVDELQHDPSNEHASNQQEQYDQPGASGSGGAGGEEAHAQQDAVDEAQAAAAAAVAEAELHSPTQGAEHEAIAAMSRLAGHDVSADNSKMQGDMSVNSQGTPGGSGSRRNKNLSVEDERARKDLHKEVERRRREQISLGIAELSQIVPNCDPKSTNKSAIVSNAVRYIQQLKQDENNNIEKWTLEKLLMDQSMNDMQKQLEATREELDRLRAHFGVAAPEADAAAEGESFFNERGAEGAVEQQQQQQQHEQQHEVAAEPEPEAEVSADVQSLRGAAEAAAEAAAQEAAANTAVAVAEVAAHLQGKARSHDEMEAESSNGVPAGAAQAGRSKRAKV